MLMHVELRNQRRLAAPKTQAKTAESIMALEAKGCSAEDQHEGISGIDSKGHTARATRPFGSIIAYLNHGGVVYARWAPLAVLQVHETVRQFH